jgi:uncharacterized membrane protein
MFHADVDVVVRYLHVMSGIFWMGLLWFFNLINAGFQKQISPEVKKDIYPKLMGPAMWWFRYTALATLVFGLILYELLRQRLGAMEINAAIYLGMILAIIMFVNVWFVIWPRQRLIIGAFKGENEAPGPDAAATAAKASRINAWLSIPMIFLMVASAHVGVGGFVRLRHLFGA